MTQENGNEVTIIEVDTPLQVAQQIAENLLFPMLDSMQKNFGEGFAAQVYQDLMALMIKTRIQGTGYAAIHEASGIIAELEEEHFPEECELSEHLLNAIDAYQGVSSPISAEFPLMGGVPS